MTEQPTAYPLAWPVNWPRTKRRTQARFGHGTTVARCLEDLENEMRLLGAKSILLSTNVTLTLRGTPRSGQSRIEDPGVALYFDLAGEPRVLACDRWASVEHNLRALVLHVKALRGVQRWGVGSTNQAFGGYKALPSRGASSALTWWQVLGLPADSDAQALRTTAAQLVKAHHPDTGSGNVELLQIILRARDEGLATLSPPDRGVNP